MEKINSTITALMGGCLSNPQSRLLPQAKASMVSSGKFEFENVGINTQTKKWEVKYTIKRLIILFFLTITIK